MSRFSRREFHRRALAGGLLAGGILTQARRAPAAITAEAARPVVTGVSCGEVGDSTALIWSRCDRPARMMVEIATDESFRHVVQRVRGGESLENRDFTGKIQVRTLPSDAELFYRVRWESLEQPGAHSEPVSGRLPTAPRTRRAVRFLWSGDTCGQGFGIDPSRGGMRTYAEMLSRRPDFFVHSGDTIYADNPFPESIALADGTHWQNIVTPETLKVAETLDEFRGNFRYNFLDEHFRAFHAAVPMLVQWDDHETRNNWFPGQVIDDDRYQVRSASLLAARARRAFLEHHPLPEPFNGRIYRSLRYGPDLELFFIDMRSERGPNNANRQTARSADSALLGETQLRWLQRRVTASTATWKIICSDMPLALAVTDGPNRFEAVANGDSGPPLGRELEIAETLEFWQRQNVRNIVWLTADVHHAASYHYSPERANFTRFDPFWEFISGPLHAGTFGPPALDATFGPEQIYCSVPPGMKPNRPPSEGLQFFGQIDVDGVTGALRVTHVNAAGENLWSTTLEPVESSSTARR